MTSFGVLLPTFDPTRTGAPAPVAQAARLAESLGYDSVWAGDHLKCPAPVLDSMTCLALAAGVTERVGLGTSVMLLGLRSLAWTAKQIATMQVLSGARFRLGVGVGGEFEREYEAAGVPLAGRGARLDGALERLPRFLAAGNEDSLDPPAPMPPVLVGGRSDRAMARAARYGDAWLPMWISPETLAQRAAGLDELASESGRSAPRLALLVLAHVDADPARARAQSDAHLRGQYGMALDRVERWTAFGPEAQVVEFLAPYLAIGVTEILLLPMGVDQLAQVERLAGVIERLGSLRYAGRAGGDA